MWVEYFALVKLMNPKEEIMIYLLGKIVSIISQDLCLKRISNDDQIISHDIVLKKNVCFENMNAMKNIFSTFILECTVVYWLS